MDVVALRYRVDPPKSSVWQTAGEHEMTVEPVLARRDLGKRHPHLECDPRLFGDDDYRAAIGDSATHSFEERADGGGLPAKVML